MNNCSFFFFLFPTGSIEEYRPVISPRVQKIKDIIIQKEILRDVTSSEFTLQLEVKSSKEISKIDYEMLISKLHNSYTISFNLEEFFGKLIFVIFSLF
jgi:hypothetical protein